MIRPSRYPTPEEIEAVIARARLMRAQYVGALIARGVLNLKHMFIGARRLRVDLG